MPVRLCLLALLAAALAWGALPVPGAGAASGLKFLGCLSGKLPPVKQPRTPRLGGCRLTQHAQLDAEGSGLNHLFGLTASPDGRSLYAVSSRQDAVLGFKAKPLGFQECFSGIRELGRRGSGACALFPHVGSEDATTGFNGVRFATVSPDGRSLYTVSNDGAIGIFSRNPGTGKLIYRSCLTGGKGPNTASEIGACKTIPTATRAYQGIDSGLGGIASLAVSPDGRFVYVAAGGDTAVATMVRADDSSLTFRDCISGEYGRGTGTGDPCTPIPTAVDVGFDSGMWLIKQLAISRDGRSLYGLSRGNDAVDSFSRDPATGALGFAGLSSLAFAAGKLYATAGGQSAVSSFSVAGG